MSVMLSPATLLAIRLLLFPGRPPSRRQVLDLQAAELRRLIAHAYHRVLFYRRLFDRHGLTPDMIRTPADLARVPITTRRDVQAAAPEDLIAQGVDPRRLLAHCTSGSSGVPLTIRRGPGEDLWSSALFLRMLRHFGVRLRDRRVGVRFVAGERAGPGPTRRALRALGFDRRATLDVTRSPEDLLAALRRLKPDVLFGYPNYLARLARLTTAQDRAAIRPRLAVCGAEVLTPAMRAAITEGFGARVFDWYGSQELGMVAWECRHTGSFHVADDAVIVEVLRDGQPVSPGEAGQVVGTRLQAYAMPFIRYEQGDVVTQGAPACPCGEPWSTIHTVEGRMRDLLDWLQEFRFIQERRDRIVVQMVAPSPPPGGLARIAATLTERLEPGVELALELVSHIDPGPGGKFRMARSFVDPDYDGIDWDRRRTAEFPGPARDQDAPSRSRRDD
jgi:phenylacetate-CoA ligase